MSGEQALERSVLERKERDELQTIAEALGVKPGARTKKADLIAHILLAAGVEPQPAAANGAEEPAARPRRARAPRAKAGDAGAGPGPATVADEASSPSPGGGDEPDAAPATPSSSVETGTAQEAVEPPAVNGKDAGSDQPHGAGPLPAVPEAPAVDEAPAPDRPAPAGTVEGDGAGSSRGRDERNQRGPQGATAEAAGPHSAQNQPRTDRQPGSFEEGGSRRSRRRRGRDRGPERDFKVQEQGSDQQYQGELIPVAGLLELTEQGYGYVRTKGYLSSSRDVYVSTSQAKRFSLRKGDQVEGAARPPIGNERYGALMRIDTIAGLSVEEARQRPRFEDLTPLFPDVKLKMELPGQPAAITARIVDLIAPIGKGQRGMIVSPPKAGKTTVIKQIATSIENNNPEVHLMVLLVDERPEEVTDMRRHVKGEVVASTFDRPAEEHTIVAELAIERAKRLVETGRDVVVILDGITRLARAYNLSAPASGRLTSGGIDQAAIYPPKKFFGAARNLEEGGSLTILATALVETGSKADDVIFEEFKGTGNMELRLDRRLAERRIYPAIDVNASSTRHEELLFERKQLELVWRLRRVLNGLADDGTSAKALELLIEKLKTTRNNDEFLTEVAKAQGTI
ncbi:MAG: transcription termination factor Rho [Actinobacteria bacterium]|nr:transcription termination factor Rho [Actinomycetota bacterium]